jgi:hypothetical protein
MECGESEGKCGEDFQRCVTKIGNVLTALNLRLAARQFHRKNFRSLDFCSTLCQDKVRQNLKKSTRNFSISFISLQFKILGNRMKHFVDNGFRLFEVRLITPVIFSLLLLCETALISTKFLPLIALLPFQKSKNQHH